MKNLPSPARAERNQERKRQYLPPLWPLVAIIVVIVGIALLSKH